MALESCMLRKSLFLACLLSVALVSALPVSAQAQTSAPASGNVPPVATVNWVVAPLVIGRQERGARALITLRGQVKDGWHVYALTQPENGPTPLVVTLEANALAKTAGKPVGSAPTQAFDRSFNLNLPYYERGFQVNLPLRLAPHLTSGRYSLPVSIRFQTCNGRICEPPKTVHLAVPVEVGAA